VPRKPPVALPSLTLTSPALVEREVNRLPLLVEVDDVLVLEVLDELLDERLLELDELVILLDPEDVAEDVLVVLVVVVVDVADVDVAGTTTTVEIGSAQTRSQAHSCPRVEAKISTVTASKLIVSLFLLRNILV
jgi:hypothetical protein